MFLWCREAPYGDILIAVCVWYKFFFRESSSLLHSLDLQCAHGPA
jgi:hypothetical protein